MSDHEFEKQVRQKLNDLRLTPSPSAWENIEQGIRTPSRRRTPLYWLAVLLIGIAAGGYFYATHDNTQLHDKESEGGMAALPGQSSSNGKGEESLRTIPAQAENAKPDAAINAENLKQPNRVAEKTSVPGRLPRTKNIVQPGTIKTTANSRITKLLPASIADQPSKVQAVDGKNDITETKTLRYYSTLLSTSSPFIDPIDPATFQNNLIPVLLQSPISPAAPIIIPHKKWAFGITGGAGVSGLNNGDLFDLSKAMTADMSTPVTAAFAPSYTPYRIEPSFAYSAGITIKRELSKRFHITGGINYLQLNVKYKPGNQVYGSQAVNAAPLGQFVRNYFTLDQHKPSDYKNTYHFIEVPLMLHTRIIRSQALPVYWNTGISYSYLVNSNSKQFDGSTGVYYSNEKSLRNSQLAVATGFDFALFSKSKYPVWIGPTAKYNVTRLMKNDLPDNKRILSAGINAKVFLR